MVRPGMNKPHATRIPQCVLVRPVPNQESFNQPQNTSSMNKPGSEIQYRCVKSTQMHRPHGPSPSSLGSGSLVMRYRVRNPIYLSQAVQMNAHRRITTTGAARDIGWDQRPVDSRSRTPQWVQVYIRRKTFNRQAEVWDGGSECYKQC